MRVIFMGTPDFAVGTLEEIIKAGHEVVLVVSQPDKAVGRSKALRYTPVSYTHLLQVRRKECKKFRLGRDIQGKEEQTWQKRQILVREKRRR